jgi:hypothetical protein
MSREEALKILGLQEEPLKSNSSSTSPADDAESSRSRRLGLHRRKINEAKDVLLGR